METNESVGNTAQQRSERDVAEKLLHTVRKLSHDLHPSNEDIDRYGLDDDLDARFGFDSLGRAELMLRLERLFNVRLADELRAAAQTPRDLLTALMQAEVRVAGPVTRTVAAIEPGAVEPVPENIETLTGALLWHAEHSPDRPHILLSNGDEEEPPLTYAMLVEAAGAVARGLRAWGLETGETVAIMLPTSKAFFLAFIGTQMAGGIPVPLYPPARPDLIEQHLRSRAKMLENAGAALLLTVPHARQIGRLLLAAVPALRDVRTVDEVASPSTEPLPLDAKRDDICLLQYTSGSTGNPKGVVLTHANVMANVRAMGRAVAATTDDVYVSWLPLYHDMGLVGAWLSCLHFAVPTIIMSPLSFLARPDRWLWAINRNRGTISAAPNFAYSLCAKKILDSDIEGLDLSSWRFTANAAEPVSPETMRRFIERFEPYGFRPEAMSPSYGLAESVTGLTFPELDRGPWIDTISRDTLFRHGTAAPEPIGSPGALEMVSCGRPMLGHQVRVVDQTGFELPDRHQGRLQFKGPSATSGYFRDPEKTSGLFDGDWLESGDLAYIADGEVFITGRTKDVIIRAGRLIHPSEVEDAVGRIEGVTPGAVILFGVADPATGTEKLVILAESKIADPAVTARLSAETRDLALQILGEPVEDVVILPRHAIPKTSSGKVRRFQAKDDYLHGRIADVPKAVWWQLTRFALAGIRGRIVRFARSARSWAYAVYWWTVALFFAVLLWPLMLVLPKLSWRWSVMHRAIRAALFLQGHALEVEAEAPPPARNAVFVANHTSYLDNAVLAAALPGELCFVGYWELQENWFEGPILRALGTLFVERFETESALRHTEQAVALARTGRSLVFYPEATIMRMPGLLDFRLGAFMTAARAGVPIVPIAIRGARSALRHDHRWFPRRAALSAHIGAPIPPTGEDFDAAIDMKKKARAFILANCAEPDLARETAQF